MKKLILISALLLFASNGWAYSETDLAIAPITVLQAQEQEDNAVVITPEEEAAVEEEATQFQNYFSNFETALLVFGIVLFFLFIYKMFKVGRENPDPEYGCLVKLFKYTVFLLIVIVVCIAIVSIFAMFFL